MRTLSTIGLVLMTTALLTGCAVEGDDLFGPAVEDDGATLDNNGVGTMMDEPAEPVDTLDEDEMDTVDSFSCEIVVGELDCAATGAPSMLLSVESIIGGEYPIDDGTLTIWSNGKTFGYHASRPVGAVIVQGHKNATVCHANGDMLYGVDGVEASSDDVSMDSAVVTFCGGGVR
jgi:hypothetical protein